MQVLVTGGTGFLGRHVVRTLVARGHAVRVLVRSDGAALARDGATPVKGDVLDRATLGPAVEGAEAVIHLAGVVAHQGSATRLFDVHVTGTRNLLEACAGRPGLQRFVHVSSSGTVAVSESPVVHKDDAPWATHAVRRWPYYLSKLYGEKVARERTDVPVVVVSPSLLLGPDDEGLSSSRVLVRFLRREVAAVPPGGLSFVDVRDAAEAVVAAVARGRVGERYLLGGANMTLEAFFVLLGKISGVPAPALRVGADLTSRVSDVLGALEGIADDGSDEGPAYAMANHFWYVDSTRAQKELGFAPRPADATLRDAVAWLRGRETLPRGGGLLGAVVGGLRRAVGPR